MFSIPVFSTVKESLSLFKQNFIKALLLVASYSVIGWGAYELMLNMYNSDITADFGEFLKRDSERNPNFLVAVFNFTPFVIFLLTQAALSLAWMNRLVTYNQSKRTFRALVWNSIKLLLFFLCLIVFCMAVVAAVSAMIEIANLSITKLLNEEGLGGTVGYMHYFWVILRFVTAFTFVGFILAWSLPCPVVCSVGGKHRNGFVISKFIGGSIFKCLAVLNIIPTLIFILALNLFSVSIFENWFVIGDNASNLEKVIYGALWITPISLWLLLNLTLAVVICQKRAKEMNFSCEAYLLSVSHGSVLGYSLGFGSLFGRNYDPDYDPDYDPNRH